MMRSTGHPAGSPGKIQVLSERAATLERFETGLHSPEDCQEMDTEALDQVINSQLTPEERLAAATIRRAVEDVQTYVTMRDSGDEPNLAVLARWRTKALRSTLWMMETKETSRMGITFQECCDAYGADPDKIRESIEKIIGIEEGCLCES